MLDLVQLWTLKANLAQDHAFEAHKDIAHATLDAIWIVTLGAAAKTIASQTKMLETLSEFNVPSERNKPVEFPNAPHPPAFDAVLTLTDAMEPLMSSPFPKVHHWFLRQRTSYKNAQKYKNQAIDTMMKEALEKFSNQKIGDLEKQGKDRSALDHMIRRELLASRKESREPQ